MATAGKCDGDLGGFASEEAVAPNASCLMHELFVNIEIMEPRRWGVRQVGAVMLRGFCVDWLIMGA
jgi:hypothetical protein